MLYLCNVEITETLSNTYFACVTYTPNWLGRLLQAQPSRYEIYGHDATWKHKISSRPVTDLKLIKKLHAAYLVHNSVLKK